MNALPVVPAPPVAADGGGAVCFISSDLAIPWTLWLLRLHAEIINQERVDIRALLDRLIDSRAAAVTR